MVELLHSTTHFSGFYKKHVVVAVVNFYSKEPKSVTTLDLFTFFCTDLIQSGASWKLSSTSDWLMSTWKNTFELLAVSERVKIDLVVTRINWVWSNKNTFAFKNLSQTQAVRTRRPTIRKVWGWVLTRVFTVMSQSSQNKLFDWLYRTQKIPLTLKQYQVCFQRTITI